MSPPLPPGATRILVVCSGNICRSPFAEGYLRMRLGERRMAHVEVGSGGTLDIIGEPASDETLVLAHEAGFDLDAHRSRGLTPDDLDAAHIILVMEREHRRELAARSPEKSDTIWLLREFDPKAGRRLRASDIFDPIGRPMADYRRCFREITASLDGFVNRWLDSGAATAGGR